MHPDFAEFNQNGVVEWIGLSSARRAPIAVQSEVEINEEGIVGDHHSKRKISFIQLEHLATISSLLGGREVEPQELRRNLLVSGVNLVALIDLKFQIGEVQFVGTGPCPPCQLMEENLGPGGFTAMVGHGGIVADVIKPGRIKVGDSLRPIMVL